MKREYDAHELNKAYVRLLLRKWEWEQAGMRAEEILRAMVLV